MVKKTGSKGIELTISQLCEELGIKPDMAKEELKKNLTLKLAPLIPVYRAFINPDHMGYLNYSIAAIKGGRSDRDLRYLESKGFVKNDGEREQALSAGITAKQGPVVLYKPTEKGYDAAHLTVNLQ